MTMNEIRRKMLKVNIRRYKIYLSCNILSVTLFYCFAAFFTNQSFMNGSIVDPMISSNIYAPSLFVGVFIILFVPYANHTFLKNRKYEYGVLMSLGMNEKDVLYSVLYEGALIAGVSMVCGLILGTILSFIFFEIVQLFIGITGFKWYFTIRSYEVTALLYGITVLITLLVSIIDIIKKQALDMMKDKFRIENSKKPKRKYFFIGLFILLLQGIILLISCGIKDGNIDKRLWVLNNCIILVGFYMCYFHMGSWKEYRGSKDSDVKRRHILDMAFLRQHYHSTIKVGMVATCFIGFSIFFMATSMVLSPSLKHNAKRYSPYDMVYSNIFSMNQVKDNKIINILKQNRVSVRSIKKVDYLRSRAFNILSESEVNKEFGCNYQVVKGDFITILQYDKKDGYEHDPIDFGTIKISCGKNDISLTQKKSVIRILFNKNPTLADYTIVVNDNDYKKIAYNGKGVWQGTMNLYTFNHWENSKNGIDGVQKYLLLKNRVSKMDERYYEASSRIENVIIARHSAEFLIFLMIFIVLLFCGAANVMVHFKVKSESEEEKRLLFGLYRIGITNQEMINFIRNKNMSYYIPQIIFGLCFSTFYNYLVNRSTNYGWRAVEYSILVGGIIFIMQFLYISRYSRKELSYLMDEFIEE